MPLEKALEIIRKDTPRALDVRCYDALAFAVRKSGPIAAPSAPVQ